MHTPLKYTHSHMHTTNILTLTLTDTYTTLHTCTHITTHIFPIHTSAPTHALTPLTHTHPPKYVCVTMLGAVSVNSWMAFHATYKSRPFVFNEDPNSYNDRFVYCWSEVKVASTKCYSLFLLCSKPLVIAHYFISVPSPICWACLYNIGGKGPWILYTLHVVFWLLA